jgi:hypothetical protein
LIKYKTLNRFGYRTSFSQWPYPIGDGLDGGVSVGRGYADAGRLHHRQIGFGISNRQHIVPIKPPLLAPRQQGGFFGVQRLALGYDLSDHFGVVGQAAFALPLDSVRYNRRATRHEGFPLDSDARPGLLLIGK